MTPADQKLIAELFDALLAHVRAAKTALVTIELILERGDYGLPDVLAEALDTVEAEAEEWTGVKYDGDDDDDDDDVDDDAEDDADDDAED